MSPNTNLNLKKQHNIPKTDIIYIREYFHQYFWKIKTGHFFSACIDAAMTSAVSVPPGLLISHLIWPLLLFCTLFTFLPILYYSLLHIYCVLPSCIVCIPVCFILVGLLCITSCCVCFPPIRVLVCVLGPVASSNQLPRSHLPPHLFLVYSSVCLFQFVNEVPAWFTSPELANCASSDSS